MFEGIVASLLNRYLGKYIEDLDLENLNVGIFGGNVFLSNLKLKTEALYELGLPIEVKAGSIGKFNVNIPWNGLSSQPVVIKIEEIFIVAGQVIDREWDTELEKRLARAAKKRILESIDNLSIFGNGSMENGGFLETLITTVMNNLQIYIRGVHIRFEDSMTNTDSPRALGLCIQTISLETTNSKWKPILSQQNGQTSVYEIVKIDSASFYCNTMCSTLLYTNETMVSDWQDKMRSGLNNFNINEEPLEFILKPVVLKIKIIVNKSNEVRVPKLLVDFVLQDAALQMSRKQFVALMETAEFMKLAEINRLFRDIRPTNTVLKDNKSWWIYAYKCVLRQRVTLQWNKIKMHRKNYKSYINVYKKVLVNPNDTELKIDLQMLEDELDIFNLVLAREHAKIELCEENPESVTIQECQSKWWDPINSKSRYRLCLTSDKSKTFWNLLSQSEKDRLNDLLCKTGGSDTLRHDKPKQYIEHKINLTIANCLVSLISGSNELMVITIGHLMSSLETRPSAKAYKISTRIESINVEATVEYSLVPIIDTCAMRGNSLKYFLSIDFEKNPLNSEADYGLNITSESMEVVYHEFAISALLSFFYYNQKINIESTIEKFSKTISETFVRLFNSNRPETKFRKILLNIDLQLPYIVIPEFGSIQRGENIMVIDFGGLKIKSDLQPETICLDDVTQMEMEEKLYDRYHIDIDGFQLIFCNSGNDWRNLRNEMDSSLHLLGKTVTQIVVSNSIRPEYKQLAKRKINISVQSVRLNLSDQKIYSILDFIENTPIPINHVSSATLKKHYSDDNEVYALDMINLHQNMEELQELKSTLALYQKFKGISTRSTEERAEVKKAFKAVDKRSIVSSEISDEEFAELWARTVDLPGFDDNVSPNNTITSLFRCVIGEISIDFYCSNEIVENSFLNLTFKRFCCDLAIMEYGPAVQMSIGSIYLSDLQHICKSGHTVILFSITTNCLVQESINLLYRKVKADCPDFKSHFHSVEKSLVLDLNHVSCVFHRTSFIKFYKFMQYIIQRIGNRRIFSSLTTENIQNCVNNCFSNNDPPVPQGATKFSYSARISNFQILICDTEFEFLDVKIGGLESDCTFKANDRMVFRFYVMSMSIDDLSRMTLYPKLLYTDADKLLEFKYVRHNPRLYKTNIEAQTDDVKSDGSIKLYIGQVHITVLCSILLDFQYFMDPIISEELVDFSRRLRKVLFPFTPDFRNGWKSKMHLLICLHLPVVLLPQNSTSPNVILCSLGDLTVENFFKEQLKKDYDNLDIVDNILANWDAINVSRAIMTLDGTLVIQEPMVESFGIRLNIKRNTTNKLLYRMNGGIDNIQINLGQKDFATFLLVWADNFEYGHCIEEMLYMMMPHISGILEDQDLKKIQVFFNHETSIHEIDFKFSIDGIQIALFANSDEILSSPIRDINHSLCRFDLDEINIKIDMFSDDRVVLNTTVQRCTLEDTRRHNTSEKMIFEPVGPSDSSNEVHISVSTPPLFDLSFEKTYSGDRTIHIHLDKTRLNFSIPFVVELTQFVLDSLPIKRKNTDGNLASPMINVDSHRKYPDEKRSVEKKPMNIEKQSALTISVRFGRPEIAILPPGVEELDIRDQVLLCRTEFLLDYGRHPGHEERLVCSLSNFHILAVSKKRRAEKMVLHPCDIEFSRTLKSGDHDAIEILIRSSPLNVHLSTSTVHIILNAIELMEFNYDEDPDFDGSSYREFKNDDLWTPKSIVPSTVPNKIVPKGTFFSFFQSKFSDTMDVKSENLELYVQDINVSLELEELDLEDIPMIMLKSSLKIQVKDWSDQFNLKGGLNLKASYFNCNLSVWEPFIEPWNVKLKGFLGKFNVKHMDLGDVFVQSSHQSIVEGESESSDDESEAEMKFIRKTVKSRETSLEKWYSDDSDSDQETGVMDKLAKAITHLISDECSDEDLTNSDSSDESGAEQESRNISQERTKKKISYSSDSGLENDSEGLETSTYIIFETERLEVSFTPANISVIDTLIKSLYNPKTDDCDSTESFVLVNDLAVRSIVMLFQKTERGLEQILEAIDGSRTSSISRQSMSNDCTFVNNLTKKNNHENVDDNSSEMMYKKITDYQLNIKVEGFDDLIVVCPKRTSNKLHALSPVKNDTRYWIMVSVVSKKLSHIITIRSPLMLKNDTSYPLMIHYNRTEAIDTFEMDTGVVEESDNPFESTCTLAILEAGSIFNVPIALAYHSKLFLSPANLQNYLVSDSGVWWPDLSVDTSCAKELVCATSKVDEQPNFSIRVVCEEGEPVFNRASRTVPNYTLRAVPPVVIHNFLPFAIEFSFPNFKHHIEASEKIDVYMLNITHRVLKTDLIVPSYLGISWSGSFNLRKDINEKTVNMSTEHDTDGGNKHLKISIKITNEDSCCIFIHSPYWIVNKTGLPLQLRGSRSDIVYESHTEEPLLFSYKRLKKRCIKLRAYHSNWSSAFSMDTVYCPGLVICKDKERQKKYRILMKPVLSHLCPHLTTIVTFLPNFSVVNSFNRSLRFMEDNQDADLWTDILQGQTLPFWPETDSMRMFVKLRDGKSGSQHFSIIKEEQTVLRMDKGRALVVKITGGGDNPFLISFHKFCQNDAPVRVDNMCDDIFLKIHQKNLGQVTLLSPHQSLLYTWDDPTEERVLYWNAYSKKNKSYVAEFEKDGFGQKWISFCQIKPAEIANINLNFIKLITNQHLESSDTSDTSDSDSDAGPPIRLPRTKKSKVLVYWVSYMDAAGQRVLLFTQDEKAAATARKNIENNQSSIDLIVAMDGLGLSLSTSRGVHTEEIAYLSLTDSASEWMVRVRNVWKPFTVELACWLEDMWKNDDKKAHLKDYVHVDFDKMQMIRPFFGHLRRSYNPAARIRCKFTSKSTTVCFKIHRIQLDNQLSDCTFKTALYQTSVCKTFPQYCKPFLELSYSKTPISNHYDVYKYFDISLQDFTLQLDRTFVVSMHKTLSPLLAVFECPLDARFRQDVSSLHAPNIPPGRNPGKVFVEYFHCSPFNIRLSFSAKVPEFSPLKSSNSFATDALLYVLDGHSNRLSDIKAVNLNVNSLTRKGLYKESFNSMFSYGLKNYARQLLKQCHVSIFNLDVLENIYEMDEIDEKLNFEEYLGPFIEEVQDSFRAIESVEKWNFEELLPEQMISVHKGTEMSVLLSMSGAIQRPHIGGEDESAAESFFRGPGRNLLAVLSKSNVSDKVSMAYDGVKRIIESGEEVVMRTRIPRYVNPMGMKSYSMYEAVGLHLFKMLSRSLSNDGYWAHVSLLPEGKKVLLITLRRVILAEKYRTKGPWEIEWSIYVDNIIGVPTVEENKLSFKVRQDEHHSSYFFRGDEKCIEYNDKTTLKWIKNKIQQVMVLGYEDKPLNS